MSIVLKDGTVLPDLPEVFLSEYQYYAICSYDSVLEVDGAHLAIFANSPIIYVPVGITAFFEEPTLISEQAGYVLLAFAPSETTEWEMASQSASSILTIYAPVENDDKFVWSNHDILTATSFEIASDFSSISVTTGEIYFPNSLAKPPFILPDGTELPALPDGCFDGTPYGVVLNVFDQYCSFGVVQHPFCALDTGEEAYGWQSIFQPGRLRSWTLEGDAWVLSEDENYDEPIPGTTSVTCPILWANFDIMYLSDYNEDDGSYTIGTEIARKSDVNYRVTGGYMTSITNEGRRLGGVAGEMKPDVLESTLRGVTGGGNLPNAEDMVFGSDGSSSEYGIFLKDDSPISTSSNDGTMGWAFTVLDDIVVKGLRYYSPGNAIDKSRIIRLWSGDGREVLVEYSAPNDSITDPSGWVDHMLETPLTLEAGKTYNLSVYSTVGIARTAVENVTLNPKIQYVRYWFVDNEHMFDFGSSDYKDTVVLCDFVADTDDAGENVNQPCIIQSDTVDDIADEAKRIVGKSGKISPAQIVSALKGVTAGGGDGPQLAPNERIYQVGNATATISENDISWTTTATGSVS